MREAVKIADRHEVVLAFEPENHNVVNSVAKARMLLDQVGSPWLKVVIDPANLLRADEFPRMEEVLDEAFDWLGKDIVLAHAKNPATGRAPEETITVQDYLQKYQGRFHQLLSTITSISLESARLRQVFGETLANEIPRYLVDRQEFYFHYIEPDRGRLRRGAGDARDRGG